MLTGADKNQMKITYREAKKKEARLNMLNNEAIWQKNKRKVMKTKITQSL